MRKHLFLLLPAIGFGLVFSGEAAASEPSVSLSAMSGYALEHNDVTKSNDSAAAFSFAVGVGTSPLSKIVVGGVFHSTTFFPLGTEIGLSFRISTGGYARGEWGVALDLGAAFRPFGEGQYGRWPLQGRIIAGAPWGLQLAVGGDVWNIPGDAGPYAHGINITAGIDLLRLTVMRQGSTEVYWENRRPVGGRMKNE